MYISSSGLVIVCLGPLHVCISRPGNFIFSWKLNKGYLIDFNLATDLQSKYTIGSKSKSSHNVSINHVPLPHSNSAPTIKDDKLVNNLDDVLVLPLNVDRRGREI
ncbi:uncharacterized protein LOC136068941 isoform X2 [Quercus suber]|uniref:uncharacterized protein LOC136068941 isoform X2 n=2 Tax=Quercus suber TaxID=58331 RepID=UPI000D2EC37A|nr:hypothetical protein CFP56_61235 [Quercus suber]